MLKTLIGIIAILHGLVHVWFIVLSQRLVEYQQDMGWTGKSWLLTNLLGDSFTRSLASGFYGLSSLGFVAGGVGLILQQEWWRPLIIVSALLSSVTILFFWDGRLEMIVQKGLLGLMINLGLLVAFWLFRISL